jgi:peptidoglycan/LPS O-acetylase OafA/YrhL
MPIAVTNRLGHVPALNGLRGLAIVAVMGYHLDLLPGGFLGVDLFFVLSGFLITALLLKEHSERGAISLRRFYGRRARRLLPVAIAAIVFIEIILVAANNGLRGQALVGVYSAFYVENFAHFLNPPVISQLGHFWSLSQEEQFYFVWPPLLVVVLRRRIPPEWIAIGLAVTAALIIGRRTVLADDWHRFYYAPDTHADGMALGCLLAVAWVNGWLHRVRSWSVIGVAALTALVLDLLLLHAESSAAGLYGITVANFAASMLIGSVLASPTGLLTRALSWRPLLVAGVMSYSLYVWQPIVASALPVNGVVMLAIAVVVAALSYRFIEEPFRHPRSSAPPSTPMEQPPATVLTGPVTAST